MQILMEAGTNRFENIERLMMVLVKLYGLCIILAKSLAKQLDLDPRSDCFAKYSALRVGTGLRACR